MKQVSTQRSLNNILRRIKFKVFSIGYQLGQHLLLPGVQCNLRVPTVVDVLISEVLDVLGAFVGLRSPVRDMLHMLYCECQTQ